MPEKQVFWLLFFVRQVPGSLLVDMSSLGELMVSVGL